MALFRGFGARKDATRGTAPVETRKDLAGLVAPVSGSYVAGLSGVLPSGRVVLVQGTSGWAYQVLGFHAVTSRGEADGVQVFGNDGPVTVGTGGVGTTVPAAPGSGLQRIDIVWVMHPSAGDNADTSSEPVFGVSSGTPASVPTAPTIPTGALELARNTMTSAATTTASAGNSITQTFRRTALRGAPVQVRDLAERTTRATQVSFGTASPLLVWRIDAGVFEHTTDGTTWKQTATSRGAWASYTPVWSTASGAQPSVGTSGGSITGRYKIVDDVVFFSIRMQIGTVSASGGSGAWRWSLPLPATGQDVAVQGWSFNGSGNIPISGTITPGSTLITNAVNGNSVAMGSSYALAGGSIVIWSGWYEAVSV
jgi:hypothetical protein